MDSDWGNCINDRRSYIGYVFFLSHAPITWKSRKQRTVALSFTEAEYMGLTEATKEVIYLHRFLTEIGLKNLFMLIIYNDSASTQELARNPVYHGRTKHIDVRHHFVREALKNHQIKLDYLCSAEMIADIFTKALPLNKHYKCIELLGSFSTNKIVSRLSFIFFLKFLRGSVGYM